MKKYLFIFTLLFGLACMTTGCNNSDEEEQPVIPNLSTQMNRQLTASYEGENYTITYAITTDDRPYVDSNADWVRIVSSDNTKARITVEPNEGETRTAEVRISYGNAEPLVFTITQEAMPPFSERLKVSVEPDCESFTVTVENLEGEDLWYYYMAVTKAYYDEFIAPDPAAWVIENARQKYDAWLNYYMTWSSNPLSFTEYYLLTNESQSKNTFQQFNDGSEVTPDTEYVALAYDLDPEGNCNGNYSICSFRTNPLPPVETIDVTFDLVISYRPEEDSRYPFRIDITPSIENCYFFYYIATEADFQMALSALGGGDINKMTQEVYKQLGDLGELYKYRYYGQYYQTWSFPVGSDGKVSLRAIACGLDPYDRINSTTTLSECYTFTVSQ